jgi:hypothetical protein
MLDFPARHVVDDLFSEPSELGGVFGANTQLSII